MSLLVSPIANLIGSGHSVNEDEFLDFFEIDANTYPRTYIFLKAQKTIFESIQHEISQLTVDEKFKESLDFVTTMTNSLLNSEFGEVFDKAKEAIPSIRDFINNQKEETPEKIIKISQKLLSSSIALSRVFSIIAYSLPSKDQAPDDQSDQTNEANQYSPDLQDVLVLCRICEEYVPLSQIEQHSKLCAREHESRFRMISVDERIAKLQKSIKTILLKPVWPGTKDKCINVYLPLFHINMLLDKALHTRTLTNNDARVLGIILSSVSRIKIRIENQNIDSMFQKSKELVNEKLKVCISRISASPLQTTTIDQPPEPHRIEVTIADFEIIKRISSGAYARVFLARKKKTGDIYAMKVIPKSSVLQKNQMQRLLNEKDIMLQNENTFIVNFCMFFIFFYISAFPILFFIFCTIFLIHLNSVFLLFQIKWKKNCYFISYDH